MVEGRCNFRDVTLDQAKPELSGEKGTEDATRSFYDTTAADTKAADHDANITEQKPLESDTR